MRITGYILLLCVCTAIAFWAGMKLSSMTEPPLPKEYDEFRRLYGQSSDPGLSWLSDARYRVFGRFLLMRAKDKKVPALYLAPMNSAPFPIVMIKPAPDTDHLGTIDVRDLRGNTVSIVDEDADGVFDILILDNDASDIIRMDRGLTGNWVVKEKSIKP